MTNKEEEMQVMKIIAVMVVSANLILLHSTELDDRLLVAVEKGDVTEVKTLLDAGASPDGSWGRAVSVGYAAGYHDSQTEDISLLYHPLIKAVEHGHIEIVELLLERGTNVDFRNEELETALMIAADRGYTKIVRLLLDNGACTSITDRSMLTVLERLQQRHSERVKLLSSKNQKLVDGIKKEIAEDMKIQEILRDKKPVFLDLAVEAYRGWMDRLQKRVIDSVACRIYREGNTIQWFFDYWREIDMAKGVDTVFEKRMQYFASDIVNSIPIEAVFISVGKEYDWTFSKVYFTLNEKIIRGWIYLNDCRKLFNIEDVNEKGRFLADNFHWQL